MTDDTMHCLVCGRTGDRGDFDSFLAAASSPGISHKIDKGLPFCNACVDDGRDACLVNLKYVKVTETLGYQGPFPYYIDQYGKLRPWRVVLLDEHNDHETEVGRVEFSDAAEAFCEGWIAAWKRQEKVIEQARAAIGIDEEIPEPFRYDPRDDNSPGVW